MIIEIGSGKGIITDEIINRMNYESQVIGVEIDRKYGEYLKMKYISNERVRISIEDFLEFSLPKKRFTIISNLPFNCTSQILNKILNPQSSMEEALLIIQKEAAIMFMGSPNNNLKSLKAYPFWDFKIFHEFNKRDFNPLPEVEIVAYEQFGDATHRGAILDTVWDEAVAKGVEYFMQDKVHEKENLTDTEVRNRRAIDYLKDDFGIDYLYEISETLRNIDRLIDSLDIPDSVKTRFKVALQDSVIDPYANTTAVPFEKSPSIKICPANIVRCCKEMARGMGEELTAELFRTMIKFSVAHEFGHYLDKQAPELESRRKSWFSYIESDMEDFPVDFKENALVSGFITDEDVMLAKSKSSAERFASFFANEVILGTTSNRKACIDFLRKKLSFDFHYMKPDVSVMIPFLVSIKDRIREKLQTAKGNEKEKLERAFRKAWQVMIEDILQNHPLSQMFPYTKEQVESMIIEKSN